MIQQIRRCDICNELANIQVKALGDASISINALDGHGDYTWRLGGGDHADLCQKHMHESFKILKKLLGSPEVEK